MDWTVGGSVVGSIAGEGDGRSNKAIVSGDACVNPWSVRFSTEEINEVDRCSTIVFNEHLPRFTKRRNAHHFPAAICVLDHQRST